MRLLTALQHALGIPDVTTEGEYGYDSTRKAVQYHDGVRKRLASTMGYMPYAYPVGGSAAQTLTLSQVLPAAGGAIAIPVVLEGHMLLDSVTFRNTDTATARGPAEFALYEDRLDNANALPLATGSVGSLATWTPSAASNRTILATSAPIYVPAGSYWLLIKNNHATNSMALGYTAAGTMSVNTVQTKTLTTAAFGSTLDLVLATWTKLTISPGVRLNGRVFGQATAF